MIEIHVTLMPSPRRSLLDNQMLGVNTRKASRTIDRE